MQKKVTLCSRAVLSRRDLVQHAVCFRRLDARALGFVIPIKVSAVDRYAVPNTARKHTANR
jgi:hypothetical protein